MSRTQFRTRQLWAQVVAGSKVLLRIIDGLLSWTPTRVNKTPLHFGKSSETPAEHIRNALAILHLSSTSVIDRADDCSLVIVPLDDWKAAWALLSTALAKLEGQAHPVPPSLTLDEPMRFVPVSGATPPPTRNVTTRERLRALDSVRDAERRRAYFGPQFS